MEKQTNQTFMKLNKEEVNSAQDKEIPAEELKKHLEQKLEKANEEFFKFSNEIGKKRYEVVLKDKKLYDFYLNEFITKVQWKGFESYAILELYENFKKEFKNKTKVKWRKDYIEATFHFLQNYQFNKTDDIQLNLEFLKKFTDLCDAFAVPMKQINDDNQKLRDLATNVQKLESELMKLNEEK